MALKDDPLIKEMNHRIAEQIDNERNYMASGKCSSFDDYKKIVGRIAGYRSSLAIIDDVIKHYQFDED